MAHNQRGMPGYPSPQYPYHRPVGVQQPSRNAPSSGSVSAPSPTGTSPQQAVQAQAAAGRYGIFHGVNVPGPPTSNSSYTPSGEIMAMINRELNPASPTLSPPSDPSSPHLLQSLPNDAVDISKGVPMSPLRPGLGLGVGGSGLGSPPANPTFAMSKADFPSLKSAVQQKGRGSTSRAAKPENIGGLGSPQQGQGEVSEKEFNDHSVRSLSGPTMDPGAYVPTLSTPPTGSYRSAAASSSSASSSSAPPPSSASAAASLASSSSTHSQQPLQLQQRQPGGVPPMTTTTTQQQQQQPPPPSHQSSTTKSVNPHSPHPVSPQRYSPTVAAMLNKNPSSHSTHSSVATPPSSTLSAPAPASSSSSSSSASKAGGDSRSEEETAGAYGMEGLLRVIQMTDTDLNMLTLGTDLTSLGLNLNSTESLHLSFSSPWCEVAGQDSPPFTLPACYRLPQSISNPEAKVQFFSDETLFFIFFAHISDEPLRKLAIKELYDRQWSLHKDSGAWVHFAPGIVPEPVPNEPRKAKINVTMFDVARWEKVSKEIIVFNPAATQQQSQQAAVPGASSSSNAQQQQSSSENSSAAATSFGKSKRTGNV